MAMMGGRKFGDQRSYIRVINPAWKTAAQYAFAAQAFACHHKNGFLVVIIAADQGSAQGVKSLFAGHIMEVYFYVDLHFAAPGLFVFTFV